MKNGLYLAARETKDWIVKVKSIEEGLEIIKGFEVIDKKENAFVEDFYCIIEVNDGTLYNAEILDA